MVVGSAERFTYLPQLVATGHGGGRAVQAVGGRTGSPVVTVLGKTLPADRTPPT